MLFLKIDIENIDDLVQLHKNCFYKKAWKKEELIKTLSLETTDAFAFYKKENMIAFLIVQSCDNESEILSVGVHSDYRSNGIATKLIEKFIADKKRGIVFLEVASDNIYAISLYEKLGFLLFSVRKNYYLHKNRRIDALNYRLIIGG